MQVTACDKCGKRADQAAIIKNEPTEIARGMISLAGIDGNHSQERMFRLLLSFDKMATGDNSPLIDLDRGCLNEIVSKLLTGQNGNGSSHDEKSADASADSGVNLTALEKLNNRLKQRESPFAGVPQSLGGEAVKREEV